MGGSEDGTATGSPVGINYEFEFNLFESVPTAPRVASVSGGQLNEIRAVMEEFVAAVGQAFKDVTGLINDELARLNEEVEKVKNERARVRIEKREGSKDRSAEENESVENMASRLRTESERALDSVVRQMNEALESISQQIGVVATTAIENRETPSRESVSSGSLKGLFKRSPKKEQDAQRAAVTNHVVSHTKGSEQADVSVVDSTSTGGMFTVSYDWQEVSDAQRALVNELNELNVGSEPDSSQVNGLGSVFMLNATQASGRGEHDSKKPGVSVFNGDETITFNNWLRKYENFGKAQDDDWTDSVMLKKLPMYLDGMALEKFEELPPLSTASWTQTKKALKEKFESASSKAIARQVLGRVRQEHGEKVSAFAHRLREAVRSALLGEGETSIKNRLLDEFLQKLAHPLSFYVEAAVPADFDTAVEKAIHYEGLLMAHKERHDKAVPLDNLLSSMQINAVGAGSSATAAKLAPIAAPIVTGSFPGACYNCGRQGHMKTQCPEPRAAPQPPLFSQQAANQNRNNSDGWYTSRGRGGSNGYQGEYTGGNSRGGFRGGFRGGNRRGGFRGDQGWQGPPQQSYNNQARAAGRSPWSNRPYCNNCGKVGHLEETCWQRQPPQLNPPNRNLLVVQHDEEKTQMQQEIQRLSELVEEQKAHNAKLALNTGDFLSMMMQENLEEFEAQGEINVLEFEPQSSLQNLVVNLGNFGFESGEVYIKDGSTNLDGQAIAEATDEAPNVLRMRLLGVERRSEWQAVLKQTEEVLSAVDDRWAGQVKELELRNWETAYCRVIDGDADREQIVFREKVRQLTVNLRIAEDTMKDPAYMAAAAFHGVPITSRVALTVKGIGLETRLQTLAEWMMDRLPPEWRKEIIHADGRVSVVAMRSLRVAPDHWTPAVVCAAQVDLWGVTPYRREEQNMSLGHRVLSRAKRKTMSELKKGAMMASNKSRTCRAQAATTNGFIGMMQAGSSNSPMASDNRLIDDLVDEFPVGNFEGAVRLEVYSAAQVYRRVQEFVPRDTKSVVVRTYGISRCEDWAEALGQMVEVNSWLTSVESAELQIFAIVDVRNEDSLTLLYSLRETWRYIEDLKARAEQALYLFTTPPRVVPEFRLTVRPCLVFKYSATDDNSSIEMQRVDALTHAVTSHLGDQAAFRMVHRSDRTSIIAEWPGHDNFVCVVQVDLIRASSAVAEQTTRREYRVESHQGEESSTHHEATTDDERGRADTEGPRQPGGHGVVYVSVVGLQEEECSDFESYPANSDTSWPLTTMRKPWLLWSRDRRWSTGMLLRTGDNLRTDRQSQPEAVAGTSTTGARRSRAGNTTQARHATRHAVARPAGISNIRQRVLQLTLACMVWQVMGSWPTTEAQSPLLCQTEHSRTFFHLPSAPICPKLNVNPQEKMKQTELKIYQPNYTKYKTPARLCSIVTRKVRFYTNAVADKFAKYFKEDAIVASAQCAAIIQTNRCQYGALVYKGGMWQTENELSFDYPWPIVGSFSYSWKQATNCFVIESEVLSQVQTEFIQSNAGIVDHCLYEKGECQLGDGSMLLWRPSLKTRCPYRELGTYRGSQLGNVWLAESHEMAVSIPRFPKVVECRGRRLWVTEQGVAVEEHALQTRRNKRSASRRARSAASNPDKQDSDNPEVGLVDSVQQAMGMTALDVGIVESVNEAFRKTIGIVCENMARMSKQINALAQANPTAAVRALTGRYDLHARAALDLVEVWPCVKLPSDSYRFRPTNSSHCYEYIPIVLDFANSSSTVFLDPRTMVVTHESPLSPCELSREQPIMLEGEHWVVDQVTGQVEAIDKAMIRNFESIHFNENEIPVIPITIFHNLVMANLTSVFATPDPSEQIRIAEQRRVMTHGNGRERPDMGSGTWYNNNPAQLSWLTRLLPEVTWWQAWVSIAAAVIYLKIMGGLVVWYIRKKLRKRRLIEALERSERVREQDRELVGPRVVQIPHYPALDLRVPTIRIEGHNRPAANNQLLDVPGNGHMGFIGAVGSTASAQIVGKMNGLAMTFLIDSGSSLTVLPLKAAKLLGVEPVPIVGNATGISGDSIKIVAQAQVDLEFGPVKKSARVLFTTSTHFIDSNTFDVVIGWDTLSLLSSFGFNNRDGSFIAEGHAVPAAKNRFLPTYVRAAENQTLAPRTQRFVNCTLTRGTRATNGEQSYVVEDEPERRTEGRPFNVMDCVVQPVKGLVRVLISNPSECPITVFKNEAVASATMILQEENGIATISAESEETDAQRAITIDPSYKVDLAAADITEEQRKQLQATIDEFIDVFSRSQYDLGKCRVEPARFETTTETPTSSKPKRTPYQYKVERDGQVQEMRKARIVFESKTPWVANFVLVPKKDGTLRLCIDFRKLNEVTIPDSFPMPRIEAVLERVANCQWYSSLDLSKGYHQIKLDDETSWKCGFVTEDKVYQFRYLPFGLKNATAIFMRAMAKVLYGLEEGVLAYVDDVLIYTKGTFNEHLEMVRKVLGRMREFNLKLSPKKCEFARKQITFLGHCIGNNNYTPAKRNIEKIMEYPRPSSLKELRRFVGMVSFFRRFIPRFSHNMEPLNKLNQKNKKFEWGEEQERAYQWAKLAITNPPVLAYPDYSKQFHIFTDASNCGQGAALMQLEENEKSKFNAISYYSRSLSASEKRQAPVHNEMGAIIAALRAFKPYIFMSEVILHTDHKPLTYLKSLSDTNPQLARWAIELQNYNVKVVHVQGEQNKVADALSRTEEDKPDTVGTATEALEDIVEYPVCLACELVQSKLVMPVQLADEALLVGQGGENTLVNTTQEQRADPALSAIIKYLETGEVPDTASEEAELRWLERASHFKLEKSGCLYYEDPNPNQRFRGQGRLVVPRTFQRLVFDHFHSSALGGGHFNPKKTLKKCQRYYWEAIAKDVFMWTKACLTCQMRNNPVPALRAAMNIVETKAVFAKIGLDHCGPLPITKNGNKYILNAICWFTRYVVAVPIPDLTAITTAKALMENVILIYGACTELVSDNGSPFSSNFFKELCALLYIKKRYSTPYHSQGNGATERAFRTYNAMQAKYISSDHSDFDAFLPYLNFCYNTTTSDSTSETPYYLMFGRDPIFSIDHMISDDIRKRVLVEFDVDKYRKELVDNLLLAWNIAYNAALKASGHQKHYYDLKRHEKDIKVGQKVLLRNYKPAASRKFALPWRGLFRVIEIEFPNATVVSCQSPQSNPFRVHLNQVKPFFEIVGPANTLPELEIEEKTALLQSKAEEIKGKIGFCHEASDRAAVPAFKLMSPPVQHKYNLRPK